MNDIGGTSPSTSVEIPAADREDVKRLMVAAMRSASARRAFLLSAGGGLPLTVSAMAETGGEVTFMSLTTGDGQFNDAALRSVLDDCEASAWSNLYADANVGFTERKPQLAFCVPLSLSDRPSSLLYLEVDDQQHVAARLEDISWLSSLFCSAVESKRLALELRVVRDEAARVERELRLSIDITPGLTWIASPEGLLQEASKSWHDYTGIPRDEAVGTGFLKAFHPDDVEKVFAAWRGLVDQGKAGGVEARILRHDGEARYFMLRAVPRFEDGKIVKWYGIDADIDDLKRAEFELAKSQAVMAEAQRIIQTGSWSWDMATDVFTFSGECANIVGVDNGDISFQTLMERVHPEDRDKVAEAHGRALMGEELNLEHRFVLPDGMVKFIHVRGRLMFDHAGNPKAYVGTMVDRTEASRSQEKLQSALEEAQRAQASLAEAQKLSHVGSYQIRTGGGEIIWSAETYNIYGLDPETALTAAAVVERIHPDDRSRVGDVFAKGLLDRKPWEIEHRLLMPDGSVRHVHCVTRVEAAPTEMPEVFGAIIDITERVRSEEALSKAQADIVRMNRLTAMGAVTVSIAHEMNQPLMAIITNAATCLAWLDRTEPDLAEAREAAERIIQEGSRAGNVLLNVRNMARNSRPCMATVDLNDVVGDVLTMLRSELRSRDIEVEVQLDTGLPPVVGDKVQLQQVLLNLILNAAESMIDMDRGWRISVETGCQKGEWVTVCVGDNGSGIDPIASERIFEAFYSTKPEGTGMGLAICRSIIESHSGRIFARSGVLQGSMVEFELPAIKEWAG